MLRRLVVRLLVLAAAFAVAAWLIPTFEITGGPLAVVWVAAVFGVVNAVVGSVLRLLTLPLRILTLGLFTLVVNGVVIALVAGLSSHLRVGSFGWAVLAALVISIVTTGLEHLTGRLARSR